MRILCALFGHEPSLAWGWIRLGAYPEMEIDMVCAKCGKLLDRKIITRADHTEALRRYNDNGGPRGPNYEPL